MDLFLYIIFHYISIYIYSFLSCCYDGLYVCNTVKLQLVTKDLKQPMILLQHIIINVSTTLPMVTLFSPPLVSTSIMFSLAVTFQY